MGFIIDTSVAVQLRDGDSDADEHLAALDHIPALSIVSHVELEGGVYARPELTSIRRAAVDILLRTFPVLAFDDACVAAYRSIVSEVGFSRRKVVDRMIAATALAHDLTLITMNGRDFQDVPGLKLEAWTA